MNIEIRQTDIETAVKVSLQVPELIAPHTAEVYYDRMKDKVSLILVAYVNGKEAGFKVGYDKFGDGSFYSWMGGVVPAYRKNLIATLLAEWQERWATKQSFTSIIFKTRNCHKTMLTFAINNGFFIIDVEERLSLDDYRIKLKKPL